MIEFKLPALGADMDKGILLEWRVTPGDLVKRGQVVAVVDTTKAAIEIECWDEGIVDQLLIEPDPAVEVPVGTPMMRLRKPGDAPTETVKTKAPAAPSRAAISAAAAPVPSPVTRPATPAPAAGERRRISPAARKQAAEKGVDLDTVTGTGPEGAVTIEDVERAAGPARVAIAAADRAAEMRKTIAAAMARSKREIPHYYLSTDIPLAAATRWMAAENEKRAVTERLLPAVAWIKAVARALKKFPELNGFFRNDRFEPQGAVHVGVAISLRQGGLIAPALLDVPDKSLDQLMRELSDLVKRARAFSLRSSELSLPTITVTNLGEQGVESVYGVIYPPQVALVGFGAVHECASIVEGAIAVVPVVTASLSADHRASDGHRGARFLNELKRLLQQPEQL
jgi:pyruvate dehydrogenase E2 component (dihydrolipoamide acetyltransferase)